MKENGETENIFNEKNEVVQKLFMMMEKMTELFFQMDTERELGWHMGKIHGWPSDLKDGLKSECMDISTGSQGVRYCTVCNYEAEDMYDLDAHTWSEHDDADESYHVTMVLTTGEI